MSHRFKSAGLLAGFASLALAASAQAQKPTAIVSIGDSAISGEAARDYEPGTDQEGNFCHRSRNALVHRTAIPGIAAKLNLACSGAESANLYINGTPQNGEPPQSEKLRAVARSHDVKSLVVEIGANDDPEFSSTVQDCIAQYVVGTGVGCRYSVGLFWNSRLTKMVPKVERALDDLRTVMRQEGYADSSYQVVLLSYWSPVSATNRYSSKGDRLLHGCPLYDADAAWGKNTAVPALSNALRGVAQRKGWRFLDIKNSLNGREVCAPGIGHAQEWSAGLTYDPFGGASWYSFDAVRQSFHANALGHAQLGRCVTQFHALPNREGRCVRGPDGQNNVALPY